MSRKIFLNKKRNKLKNNQFEEIKTNFTKIEEELNNIHHVLFSGDALKLEVLETSSKNLNDCLSYIASLSPSLVSNKNIEKLKSRAKIIPYYIFLYLLLIPFSGLYGLLLIGYMLILKKEVEALIQYEEKLKSLSIIISNLKKRIKNYFKVINKKEDRFSFY